MISHKNITRVVGLLMAAAVLVCMLAVAWPREAVETSGGSVVAMQYASALFGTGEVMQIDIQMEEEEWEEMLSRAIEEEYYACDVVINGQKICNVGIRPKGNTSLSSIAMDEETDRYSLKLEFDHYVEGQICFGLDKLILNNNYADATNMKEALVYDMYQYLGADASLYQYAEIAVNGEYWGVYLALEAVEESFLLRNYGTQEGKLYKPESMDMGGGPGGEGKPEGEFGGRGGFEPPEEEFGDREGFEPPEGEFGGREGFEPPEGEFGDKGGFEPPEEGFGNREEMEPAGMERQEKAEEGAGLPEGEPGRPERGFEGREGEFTPPEDGNMHARGPAGGQGGGADLNYIDDEPDSYTTIWEGEVTKANKSDHRRVIAALKNIDAGTELETYMDIDNILKYMAVHTFSVNLDSLSGNMAHNYYLYEYDGKLNILPWDYNLSFGGMGMGGASGMINDAIDTPFQGTEFFDALLENEEYLARYHDYLRQLTEGYVSGGRFEETYSRIRSQIDELVKNDPTAFYSYEAYEAGADMLYRTVLLRAESVQGQLDKRIPSTDEGQREENAELVDVSEIDTEVMGTFDRGRHGER